MKQLTILLSIIFIALAIANIVIIAIDNPNFSGIAGWSCAIIWCLNYFRSNND